MAQLLKLERFVEDASAGWQDFGVRDAPEPPAGPSPEEAAHARGYEKGWQAGVEAEKTEQNNQTQAALAQLADLQFTRCAAEQTAREELRPILDAVLTALLPQLQIKVLCDLICEFIEEQAAATCTSAITINVSPDMIAALSDINLPDIVLAEDPSLRSGEARIVSTSTEHLLDVSDIQTRVMSLIGAYFDSQI